MKLKVILLIVGGMLMINASAQKTKGERKEKSKERLDSIAKRYNLDESQKNKFADAMKMHRKSMKSIKMDKNADEATKKANMQARKLENNKLDSTIKTIFTPAQYAQFEKDKADRKAKHSGEKGAMRSQKIADSLSKKYQLDETKKLQVKEAYSTFFASVSKSNGNHDSTSKEARKVEMKSAKSALENKMKTILTTSQYAQWQADVKAHQKEKRNHKGNHIK